MKGSHNALTFAKPRNWLWRLVSLFWRCQAKNIQQQIESGCRAFDIRFAVNHKALPWMDTDSLPYGKYWLSAHGAVTLDIDPLQAIHDIAMGITDGDRVIVRLILEKGDNVDCIDFAATCSLLERLYPSLIFVGGNYKPTWRHLHRFRLFPESTAAEHSLVQWCGSMQSRWGGAVPRLWKWLCGRKRPDYGDTPTGYPAVLEDFV